MEQLSVYIEQARQQGQTDEQIRQALTAAGWPVEQVNAVFGAIPMPPPSPPAPANQQPAFFQPAGVTSPANPTAGTEPLSQSRTAPEKSKKLWLAIMLLVLLVIIIAGSAYALFGRKTSYQTVAKEFVAAMQNGDKAKADSLLSPVGKAKLKKVEGTTSYYTFCQNTGVFCMYYFSSKFLDKATVTSKNYTSSFYETKGEEVIYAAKQSAFGSSAGGQGCSSNSNSSLMIYLEPKGNTWLVDGADPTVSFSGNLCAQSGGPTANN